MMEKRFARTSQNTSFILSQNMEDVSILIKVHSRLTVMSRFRLKSGSNMAGRNTAKSANIDHHVVTEPSSGMNG
jgi:hypothetical protein